MIIINRRRFLGIMVAAGLIPFERVFAEDALSDGTMTNIKKFKDIYLVTVNLFVKADGVCFVAEAFVISGMAGSSSEVTLADGIKWSGAAAQSLRQQYRKAVAERKSFTDDVKAVTLEYADKPMLMLTFKNKPIVKDNRVRGYEVKLDSMQFSMLSLTNHGKDFPLHNATVTMSDKYGVVGTGQLEESDDEGSGTWFTELTPDDDKNDVFESSERFRKMIKIDSGFLGIGASKSTITVKVKTKDGKEVASVDYDASKIQKTLDVAADLGDKVYSKLSCPKLQYCDFDSLPAMPPSCFMTTATCTMLGLPDDCWELQSLRDFRDNHLVYMPGGEEDIQRYYQFAPEISRRLLSTDAGRKQLIKLYVSTILPCAILNKLGAYRTCRMLYTRMMNRLMSGLCVSARS